MENLTTLDELLDQKYGKKGAPEREKWEDGFEKFRKEAMIAEKDSKSNNLKPFRAIFCLCFGFLVIGLLGCGSHHKKADNASTSNKTDNVESSDTMDNVVENIDTSVNIKIDGRNYLLKTDKYNAPELIKIEKIAKAFQNKKLDSSKVEYSDVTGDGIPEKIVGHLYLANDSVYAIRTFYENDKVIYTEKNVEFINDTSGDNDLMGIDADLSPLEPYATVNELISYIDIYNDVLKINPKIYQNDTDIKFNLLESLLEEKHATQPEIYAQKKTFKNYLVHFKGAFLNSYDEMDEIPEIWYEPMNRFIEIY